MAIIVLNEPYCMLRGESLHDSALVEEAIKMKKGARDII